MQTFSPDLVEDHVIWHHLPTAYSMVTADVIIFSPKAFNQCCFFIFSLGKWCMDMLGFFAQVLPHTIHVSPGILGHLTARSCSRKSIRYCNISGYRYIRTYGYMQASVDSVSSCFLHYLLRTSTLSIYSGHDVNAMFNFNQNSFAYCKVADLCLASFQTLVHDENGSVIFQKTDC